MLLLRARLGCNGLAKSLRFFVSTFKEGRTFAVESPSMVTLAYGYKVCGKVKL